MKYKKYYILVFLTILFSCKDINKFSAGSYSYAEIFEIKLPKEKVMHKIDSLKINAELQVPPFEWAGQKTQLKDKSLKNGYFVFYIFLKERNQIVYSYVKKDDRNMTNIGLISIQNGLSLGNWKDINKDLNDIENEEIKKEFKKNIIDKIQ